MLQPNACEQRPQHRLHRPVIASTACASLLKMTDNLGGVNTPEEVFEWLQRAVWKQRSFPEASRG